MKLKVMYLSKSGNTKKVAEAIAKSLGQTAEAIPPAYPPDNIKLMFLGGAVYGNKIDKKMEEFIDSLTEKNVQNVALFSTSGSGKDEGIRIMKRLLSGKGINVLDDTFNCRGRFFIFLNRKYPSGDDLKYAAEFAARAAEKIKE